MELNCYNLLKTIMPLSLSLSLVRQNLQRRLTHIEGLVSPPEPPGMSSFANVLTYATRAEGHSDYIRWARTLTQASFFELESLIVSEFRCQYDFVSGPEFAFKHLINHVAPPAPGLLALEKSIGELYFNNYDYKGCIQVIEQHPSCQSRKFFNQIYAKSLFGAWRFSDSIEAIGRHLAKHGVADPKLEVFYLLQRALSARAIGNYNAAVQHCQAAERCVRRTPSDSAVQRQHEAILWIRTQIYRALGLKEKAVADLQQLVRVHMELPEISRAVQPAGLEYIARYEAALRRKTN